MKNFSVGKALAIWVEATLECFSASILARTIGLESRASTGAAMSSCKQNHSSKKPIRNRLLVTMSIIHERVPRHNSLLHSEINLQSLSPDSH
ncbi:hypothetical protein KC19_11G138700, partial [Ceratodon purpureus]